MNAAVFSPTGSGKTRLTRSTHKGSRKAGANWIFFYHLDDQRSI